MGKSVPLWIELSSECIWRCVYCYAAQNTEPVHHMTQDTISLVRKSVEEEGYNKLILSGGEPLLHPNIGEVILDFLSDDNSVTIVTSGYGIERLAPYLDRPNLHIQISLDSVVPEVNAQTRGIGSCECAVSAIDYLISHSYLPHRLVIATTLTQYNCHSLDKLYDYLLRRNIGTWHQSRLRLIGRARSLDTLALDMHVTTERMLLGYAIESLGKMNIHPPVVSQVIRGIGNLVERCSEMGVELYIDATGNVYPCVGLKGEDFKISNLHEAGNLKAIIERFQASGLREICMLRHRRLPECSDCEYTHICGAGCAESYWALGTLFAVDPIFCCVFRTLAAEISSLDPSILQSLCDSYVNHLF